MTQLTRYGYSPLIVAIAKNPLNAIRKAFTRKRGYIQLYDQTPLKGLDTSTEEA